MRARNPDRSPGPRPALDQQPTLVEVSSAATRDPRSARPWNPTGPNSDPHSDPISGSPLRPSRARPLHEPCHNGLDELQPAL